MVVLRAARVPELALQYSALSERLISYEANYVCESAASLPNSTFEALHQSIAYDLYPLGDHMYTMPMDWMQDSRTLSEERIS